MNATTHAVFGIAAFAGASLVLGVEPPVLAYPAAVVAAWLPDVDNPRSRLGNGLSRRKIAPLDALLRPVSWTLRGASFALFKTVGHRTLTHSLLGLAIFCLPVFLLLGAIPALQVALVAGVVSHVAADALNTRGVPLLWPLGTPFRLLPGGFRSGGALEFLLALVVAGAAAYEIYLLHPPLARALGVALSF